MNLSAKKTSISLFVSIVLITLITFFFAQMVVFADSAGEIKKGACAVAGDCTNDPNTVINGTIKTIINLLSIAGGVIAVIFIIIGGLKYISSGGKQESITSAKNTILYAVIGLVIIALAQVIVRFVLSNADKSSNSSGPNSSQQQNNPNNGTCARTIC